MRNRPGAMVDVVIGDGNGRMSLTFFAKNIGAAERRSTDLAVGRRGVFSGKVGEFNGMTQFAHPEYELFEDEDSARRSADARAAVPIPIYPATSAIQTWQIAASLLGCWMTCPMRQIPSPRRSARAKSCSPPRSRHWSTMHRPRTRNDIDPAVRTLRMHEALTLQTALLQQRDSIRALSATSRPALPAAAARAVRRGAFRTPSLRIRRRSGSRSPPTSSERGR